MRTSPPFLILETGTPLPALRRHGGFPHWIRVAAGLPADQMQVCRVQQGEALPRARGHAGVLVTGSGAMVSEREAWSERSAEWLRAAVEDGVPVFGICYGHQLLAHAFGGRIDYHPRGREMGTVDIELHPQAQEDPLLSGLPARIAAQTTHRQSVLEPPANARVLACSAHDACQVLRIDGFDAWGVQFHPEFSVGHMHGYVQARRQALVDEGHDPRDIAARIRPTPLARRLLRRFAARALERLA
jgi:GMP synthase (glutamine-hydrolysing)